MLIDDGRGTGQTGAERVADIEQAVGGTGLARAEGAIGLDADEAMAGGGVEFPMVVVSSIEFVKGMRRDVNCRMKQVGEIGISPQEGFVRDSCLERRRMGRWGGEQGWEGGRVRLAE